MKLVVSEGLTRQNSIDNLILPSSTYRSNRHSVIPQPEADGGGEFLIPVAFDPSEEQRSARGQLPATTYGKSPHGSESSSPHIAYQEKGRDRGDLDAARWRQDDLANGTNTARSASARSSRSDLGRKETSTFSTPSPESTKSATVQREGLAPELQRTASDNTTTLPTRPSHELRRLHETTGSVDSAQSFLSSTSVQHPKRADSLESRLHQPSRKEPGTSPRPSSVTPSDQWSERSTDRTGVSRSTPRTGDSTWTPRSELNDQAKPPARPNSISTLQQVESYRQTDGAGSPSLLRYSGGGDFTMDEDMARIMGSDDGNNAQTSESFLRRVSNSVRHGRSYSDKGSRLSRDAKWPKSPINGSAAIPDLASPSVISPENAGPEEVTWLRNELRKERQRVSDREQKIAEMEAMLNASADVKQVNTELHEKRSTMVVLDAQKEIAMRELTVLTEHLEAEKRGNGGSLDLGKLTNHVLREFVESIQKLKDTFTPQIEELVQKRNDAAEELANLNRMKDKSFQEFEQLSSKNAQLAELNNQLVHQIQELYKANPTDGRGANGLGIYSHGKEKSLSAIDALKAANSDLVPTVATTNISEEAEPATIVPGPQVVSIRKGQPRKFNWKKGGQNVAKGVTKGLKGAFMSSEATPAEGNPGLPRSQTQDPSRPGFGFFGNQRSKQTGLRMPQTDSVPALAETPAPGGKYLASFVPLAYKQITNIDQQASSVQIWNNAWSRRRASSPPSLLAVFRRSNYEVCGASYGRALGMLTVHLGMDMEGIYRKSGASSAIQTIREGFERSPQDYDISDPDLDIHAVTSALKQYFRKLPMPLITFDVYEKIIDSGEITSQPARVEHLQKNLRELPRVHQDVLEFLVFHLKRVVEREKENLMTSQNIAVVFAPTIMRPESLAREMTDVQKKNEVLKFLVENCQEIFMGLQG